MRAIILAAGVSRRLYPATYRAPKCMLRIGSKPIIDYQLEALLAADVTEIVIIVGYYRELLREHIQTTFPQADCTFIVNHHHFETNTAYSLNLGRQYLEGSTCLLMNADVLYPREMLQRLTASDHENVLAVEIKPCGREEVKVIAGDDTRIVAIGKELIQENSLGEFIGVAKLSPSFSTALADSLHHLIEAGGLADYFEAAIHPLLAEHPVHYVNISDLPCIEIDFREDLERARELVHTPGFS